MTNKEKFAKEILDIACKRMNIAIVNGFPYACDGLSCRECDLYGKDCDEKFKEWCRSEYVEPPVDWSKVPVDTPILVRDSESSHWNRRHFAFWGSGKVHAYDDGNTSWSNNGRVYDWTYAKLATSENLSRDSIMRKCVLERE